MVGLYREGRQVGFARVVSDGGIAYLADVYVLGEHRGRGLGTELVRATVDEVQQRPAVAPAHEGRARPVREVRVRTARATDSWSDRRPTEAGWPYSGAAAAGANRSAHSPSASIALPRPRPASRSASTRSGRDDPPSPFEGRYLRPRAASDVRRAGCRRCPGRARGAPEPPWPSRSTRITCGFQRRPTISAARWKCSQIRPFASTVSVSSTRACYSSSLRKPRYLWE